MKDLKIFNGVRFNDKRGFLKEVFIEKEIKQKLKFSIVSKSKRNVLRGLHLQKKNAQSKFVSVIKGKVLDVVVDLRKNSKTSLFQLSSLGNLTPQGFKLTSHSSFNILFRMSTWK